MDYLTLKQRLRKRRDYMIAFVCPLCKHEHRAKNNKWVCEYEQDCEQEYCSKAKICP